MKRYAGVIPLEPLFILIYLLSFTGCRPVSYPPGGEGIGDPYYPGLGNGGYDALHYTLDLDIDPRANTLIGLCKMEALAVQSMSAFNLDFSGLTIEWIKVNDRSAVYQHSGRELAVTPARPIQEGDRFTVEIAYQGSPKATTTLGGWFPAGWFHTQTGEVYASGEVSGAATWFPVNDHPRDKATYTYRITVPKPYQVAASGLLQQELDHGDAVTYILEAAEPVASYLVGLNIAEFVLEKIPGPDGVLIRNYLPVEFRTEMRAGIDQTAEMLAFFSERFGPYPFAAYGTVIVAIPDQGFVALETQTLSQHAHSTTALTPAIVAHELAHQWFGNSVSLENWQDIWLKEGAATYAEWLWKEQREGSQALEAKVRGVYQLQAWSTDLLGNPSPSNLFTNTIYQRGALTFHALRLRVGDDAFFQILRTYTDRYRYGNASPADFIAVAEGVSNQDLEGFFEAWIYAKQIPAIPELELQP